MHIAKVYFLKSRDDEQRLHEPLVREQSHDEASVRGYENCLGGTSAAKRGRVGRRARASSKAHAETTLQAATGLALITTCRTSALGSARIIRPAR